MNSSTVIARLQEASRSSAKNAGASTFDMTINNTASLIVGVVAGIIIKTIFDKVFPEDKS